MNHRIALVTGAGRGIGRAIAEQLARPGMRIAVTSRTIAELDGVAAEIRAAVGEPLEIVDDLSDRSAPARIVRRVEQTWGAVEILVNNAGIGSSQAPQPIVGFDDKFWDLTMAVNVTAPYLLTKLVLPAMIQARWGRIINISSMNAKIPALHGAAYVTSKHAIAGFTKATAKEIADQGITCNAICPGVIATVMNDKRLEYDSRRLGVSVADLEAQASPLGRRLLPEEVAPLAVFLASDGAVAINGQLLNVCGGTVMY